jgi:hypothetical protein
MEVQQSLSVTDSLSVGSNVSIGSSLRIIDSLTVGSKVIVNQSMYVSDTLEIGSTLKVNEIKDVENISTESLKTNSITGSNGILTIGDPIDDPEAGCDTVMAVDYCSRRIYGISNSTTNPNPGVCIGVSNIANGNNSFAVGQNSWATQANSMSLGTYVRASGNNAFVVGSGNYGSNTGGTHYLLNNIANSLMVGFNISNSKPSLFVGPSTITNLPGNVGIGTTTPADKLVIGDGYEQISFGSAMNAMSGSNGWWVGYMGMNATRTRANTWQSSVWTISGDNSAGYGGGVIATDAGGKMFIIPIATGANSTITITDEELYARRVVEIGAIDPTANPAGGMMRVNGNIVCRDLEVTLTGWWDDVFKPGYKLMSIEELEQYLAQNGHLPGVPAEADVVGQSMSVQEMNLMLLQKVEELTLYVIELQKQINSLKK